jgi:flagellar biogenesis protein FliO
MKAIRTAAWWAAFCALGLVANAAESPVTPPAPLPDTGAALFRVFGALLLVFALLFGGVWLVKNWQRLALRKGRAPKLRLLEAQSLGGRQGVYVLAYEQQRFLIAASPNGVALLSHLPESEPGAVEAPAVAAPVSFMQALQAVTSRPS